MRLAILFAALAVTAGVCTASAADAPPGYYLSPIKTSSPKAVTIMVQSIHADPKNSSTALQEAIENLYTKLNVAHIPPVGGPIMIFPSAPMKGDSVDIQIGIPVAENTKALEGYEIKVIESAPTASALFRGPFASMNRAFSDFFRQLHENGQTPAGQPRERTLYYEDEKSSNNVLLIEMPVAG